MTLTRRPYWVFDMDGTLTVPIHDFDALRVLLGLPERAPILEALDAMPAGRSGPLHNRLARWEMEHAELATPIADAVALLEYLQAQGTVMGVLTRNTRSVALRTLEVTGLDHFFASAHVLGRDNAAAKPSPEGIERLLTAWQAPAAQAVMVGDWVFDVDAGRAAGTATVWVDRYQRASDYPDRADVVVDTLESLLPRS